MGVYNSDWLLNQIRGTANVVSKAFNREDRADNLFLHKPSAPFHVSAHRYRFRR